MKLQEASILFKSLKIETIEKYEIKIYERFVYLLSELKNREFSIEKIQSIEQKLDSLNLKTNPENRKKYFKKALIEFEKYLKDTFSLTSKGHYTELGITLGSSFGIIAGIIIGERFEKSLGIALGIGLGMLIGLVLGRQMDAKAMSEGRII